MSVYRLLALNIDGTLLRSNGRLQPSTKEAIQYVQKKGVAVTLVTNRHFQSARKLAKALKLKTFYVTHGGAFIANKLDDPFFEKRISEEKTFNLIQVLENYNCHIRVVHERFSIGNKKKTPDNMVNKTLLNTSDTIFYPLQFVDSLGDTLLDEPASALKIEAVFNDEEYKREAAETIRAAFEDIDLKMIQPKKLELVAKGVSKENGLRTLARHLNIPMEEIVAIGDSIDDLDMISQVGLGVAMSNAPFEVKKAADWVTRTNDQQGVEYMVKEHFRKQQRIDFLQKIKIKK
ncbi:Cof-type HAD-IIB family hydrolase [Metabacillus fastidiosus]|uniref:Cof-type HAD-IIB family hydrolase n=1 Tax=Metabacillus fastidiosus TaxID=1458 RepID=A0ABU6NV06_9BACI|nr:Cof-type HAD-IIB family hydrolase [Metabacillus fastidiosus]MED4400438.1 Cof-type HAD-IIB family hydrolase [Metabacillus fastidiosus]MED4454155.1 Cof-type HAD-IIB family hydrolase [Metabacillus fastidiosus]MED4464322.1 Cof-type HAD-IIB family hydrolase [Metabacillus fastidiosus]